MAGESPSRGTARGSPWMLARVPLGDLVGRAQPTEGAVTMGMALLFSRQSRGAGSWVVCWRTHRC